MKPRIAIILCHPGDSLGGETREGFLASHLEDAGYSVRVYRVDTTGRCNPNQTTRRIVYRIPGTTRPLALRMCAPDDLGVPVSKVCSKVLVKEVRGYHPQIVVWKGLDYAITKQLLPELPSGTKHLSIVGGNTHDDILLDASSVIFSEFSGQVVSQVAQVTLPKWVNWDRIQHSRPRLSERSIWSWVSVGDLCERKNHAPLMREWSLTHKELGTGLVIGDGLLLPTLSNLDRSLNGRSLVYGHLPNELVLDNMQMSRIQMHPSLNEGLPRCMVEGAACGLPFVCLRSGLRMSEEPEWLFLADNVPGMVQTAQLLLDSPVTLKHMSKSSREWAMDHASWQNLIDTFYSAL